MSNPIGTATSAATSSPHGLPLLKRSSPKTCPPELENSMSAHAPTPTNVICASEICPDQPVSGTSESIGNAIEHHEREVADPDPLPDQRVDRA